MFYYLANQSKIRSKSKVACNMDIMLHTFWGIQKNHNLLLLHRRKGVCYTEHRFSTGHIFVPYVLQEYLWECCNQLFRKVSIYLKAKVSFFCKRLDGNYLRLWGVWGVCSNFSTLPLKCKNSHRQYIKKHGSVSIKLYG